MTRRIRPFALVLAVALGSHAEPAAAKPIVPGSIPLWMALANDTPTGTCPSPRALNGAGKFGLLRAYAQLSERRQDPFSLGFLLAENEALVGYCDPEALAAHRFPAPLAGELAFETTNQAWWGQQLIDGGPLDGGPNGLRPGDRVTFPPGSAAAVIDVAVSAGSAARTIRLAPSAVPLASLTVTGSVSAPTVVVTDAAGGQTSTPVAPVAAAPLRVRATRQGSRARLRISGRPNSLVFISAARGKISTLGASGRRTLTVSVGSRRRAEFAVATISPETREQRALRCEFRGARSRCGAPTSRPGLGDRLAAMSVQRPAPQPRRTSRPAARAAGAPPVVPTTVTRIAAFDLRAWWRGTLLSGDLNLDGLPDATTTDVSGKRPLTNVLVSSGAAAWQRVAIRSKSRSSFEGPFVGDVDGDGRPDLRADGGQLVTDAFLGATPAFVDLRKGRRPSDADIVPPAIGSEADLLSFTGWLDPNQGLSDVTGDGRPESLFGGDSVFTLASESLPRGRQLRLARIEGYGDLDPSMADQGGLYTADESSDLEETRRRLSTFAVAGRLFTIEPRQRSADAKQARTVDLVERTADGRAVATRTLSLEGWPQLLDIDPATGDALVWLRSATPCRPRGAAGCRERVVRIDAAGTITTDFVIARQPQTSPNGRFIDDTSDGDDRAELVFSLGDGLNSAGLVLASSELRGKVRVDRLPALSLGEGREPDWATDVQVARTADGRRWLATQTNPSFDPSKKLPQAELLLVQPR